MGDQPDAEISTWRESVETCTINILGIRQTEWSVSRTESIIPDEFGWGKLNPVRWRNWVTNSAALDSEEKRKISYVCRESNPYTTFIRSKGQSLYRNSYSVSFPRLHHEQLSSTVANHTGVLVYIIAKSRFFRSDPQNTIEMFFPFQGLFVHLRLLIFCSIASPKRREATFLRANQNPYSTPQKQHITVVTKQIPNCISIECMENGVIGLYHSIS